MIKQKVILFDIDYTLFDTGLFKKTELKRHSVYGEVNDVLRELSKTSKLAIFSEGDTDFQTAKLNNTNIKKYFAENDIHIFKSKTEGLSHVLKKYSDGRLFFVDDKLNVLFDAKKMFPDIFVIWVKRGIYAQNQRKIENFIPDGVVNNLIEILSIVNHK